MVTAAAGSHSNRLLSLLISLLEVLDAVTRWICTTWYCCTHGIGPAKAGGTNPPPPAVVGIIIAEPKTEDISLQMVANVAGWCMPYDSVHQLHLYEPSGQLKQSQPQLEQKLAEAAKQEGRNLVIKCGWSVSKPSYTASAFEQQQKRQQRLATGQQPQSAHPTQQRSWGAWLAEQIVGSGDGSRQDATPQHETQQVELLQDSSVTPSQSKLQQQRVVSTDNAHSIERQQQQAETTSTDIGAAHAGSRTECSYGACDVSGTPGAAGVRPSAAAVTVRILSAEDAFLPVIEAAAERCRSCEMPISSPAPRKQPCMLQHQDQGQQEQQQQQSRSQQRQQQAHEEQPSCVQNNSAVNYSHDPSCNCSCNSINSCSGSNGIRIEDETGMACTGQQQRSQICSTPCSNCCCYRERRDDRLAATAQHRSAQQQQQQVVAAGDSDIQTLQQQQDTCEESLTPEAELEKCMPCCERDLAQTNQYQTSQMQVATALHRQQQQQQQKPQQKQQGSVLPELAASSSPDIVQEPQVLLVFGPALTLAGYPPFHTRAAEVHYMGRLVQANKQAVAGAIASYCKVLQRHGA